MNECSRRIIATDTLAKPRVLVLYVGESLTLRSWGLCSSCNAVSMATNTNTQLLSALFFLSFHILSYIYSFLRSKLGVGVTKTVQGTTKTSGLIEFDKKIGDEKLWKFLGIRLRNNSKGASTNTDSAVRGKMKCASVHLRVRMGSWRRVVGESSAIWLGAFRGEIQETGEFWMKMRILKVKSLHINNKPMFLL